ncbi:DUF1963-domain-containing protein [Anaeromyces robustus]|uniref:DUF1963-domain-containing protein n=1 Tax=Anaeromyces robustus TaxID=1754192 RepID=A0A1Y1WXY6_9FUNG|nr:DUF1963-domain-containing protein [Anaeromyces robustus]|eukprot:ORX78411.1 DUF1963-domain-containing protein [Anaeromyces robustus]
MPEKKENLSEEFKKLVEEIKRISKTDSYQIKIETDKANIFDSKIGGIPYWTKDKEYPKNSEGEKLFLLAQINFEKCEEIDTPLPKEGMLQFFVSNDDVVGLDFDDQLKQEGFRVIYHEKIDYTLTEEKIVKEFDIPEIPKDDYELPMNKELKISLHKGIDYITPNDKNFDNIFSKVYKEVYNKEVPEDSSCFNILNDEEYDQLYELLSGFNHKMLGYPYFTQSDPRFDKKYADFDILLLQIDTDGGNDIMWGDSGICNFFIKKEALLKKDFSEVLYNWDCC